MITPRQNSQLHLYQIDALSKLCKVSTSLASDNTQNLKNYS